MGIRSFAEAMVVRELYRIRTNSLYDSYKNSLVDLIALKTCLIFSLLNMLPILIS